MTLNMYINNDYFKHQYEVDLETINRVNEFNKRNSYTYFMFMLVMMGNLTTDDKPVKVSLHPLSARQNAEGDTDT